MRLWRRDRGRHLVRRRVAAVAASSGAVSAVSAGPAAAPMGVTPAKKPWKILVPAALVVLAVAYSWWDCILRSKQSSKLTEKDSVLLADFVNTTGDAVFDGTLKQALAVQLEQSPYLNLLSRNREIREALQFMGRPATSVSPRDVAREICLREGMKAMLTGIDCQPGQSLCSHTRSGERAERRLTGSGAGGSGEQGAGAEVAGPRALPDFAEKMGESIGSVQKFATPLEAATTSSLEALQAFSLGQAEHQKMREDAAIPHLKKAVELDPNFAVAWATLGVVYANTGRSAEGAQAVKKAYELRDRASEREKLYIQAHYYTEVTIDSEKALATYAEWRQIYPRDTISYDNAALAYSGLGQHEKALDLASQAMRINPHDAYAYDNIAGAYEGLNRFDEAKSIAEQAVAEKSDGSEVHFVLTDLAYMRGDRAAYEHELDGVKGSSLEPFMLLFNAGWQASEGRVKTSHELWQRAGKVATNAGAKDLAASFLVYEANNNVELGYQAEARQKAAQAVALSKEADVASLAAVVFAFAGDLQKSESLLAGLNRDFQDNRNIQLVAAPLIRAVQQMQKNQLADAINTLETLRPYELGTGPRGAGVSPIALRGMTYLKMRDGQKAAAEFQRILDHRGAAGFALEYPLARLNLARAYVVEGDNAKARTAYQDFFAAWKDADEDIPVLKTAKAEYEKLR